MCKLFPSHYSLTNPKDRLIKFDKKFLIHTINTIIKEIILQC